MGTNIERDIRESVQPIAYALEAKGFKIVDFVSLGVLQLEAWDANRISEEIQALSEREADRTGERKLRGQTRKRSEAVHALAVETFRAMPESQRRAILSSLSDELVAVLGDIAEIEVSRQLQAERETHGGKKKEADAKPA